MLKNLVTFWFLIEELECSSCMSVLNIFLKIQLQNKVAVIKVPKMNANPILHGGEIQVISGSRRIRNDWSTGPHYYTSLPGKPITLMVVPSPEEEYVREIRFYWLFNCI